MNRTRRIQASLLTLTLGLAVLTSHAVAAEKSAHLRAPPSSVMVRFGDLNTSTVEGSTALYARVRSSAYAVCHSSPDWYPAEWWKYQDCYRATVDRVVGKLNLPQLTALHLKATGRAPTALHADNR